MNINTFKTISNLANKSVLLIAFCTTAQSVWAETLEQSWDIAIQSDHVLKQAQLNTSAATYEVEAAKSARMPGVTLQAGYTALDHAPASITSFGEMPVGDKNSLSYKAMATIPLYTGGQIDSSIQAADAKLMASHTQELGEIQNLKLKVAESFVSVLRAKKTLEVADSHVESLTAHTRDVENLYQQDMVSKNDLLTAQVALADANQESIKARNALDLAYASYNRLMGRSMSDQVSLDDVKPVSFNSDTEAMTEKALQQRPELVVLQNQIQALRHQADAIRAETGPQIALTGGYGYQENQHQVYEGQWSVNVGLKWDLFDGGSTRNRASATASQAAALQQQYDELRSNIALQVRRYWLDVQETKKRILVTEKAIMQAEENLKVNRNRYESGLSTNTEVLDAETLRARSQSNYANANFDAVLAALRLQHAMGEL